MSLTRQKRYQRWPSHQNRSKTAFLRAKLAARPMDVGASSSSIDSERSASRRLSKGKANKDGEAAAINYLHNAQGQRVFKGEPRVLNYQPSEARLGAPFTAWLEKNFAWLWDKAQAREGYKGRVLQTNRFTTFTPPKQPSRHWQATTPKTRDFST